MARNFNTNQNRHLYVATQTPDEGEKVNSQSAVGTIDLKQDKDGKEVYFVYRGADTVLHSDRIQIKNLDYVKAIKAEDLRRPFKSQVITLDEDINDGNPIISQDYILRIVLRQWIGMGNEDQYFKEACVHATSKIADAAAFYEKMVDQLNLAFAREIGADRNSNPYLKFEAITSAVTVYDPESKESKSIPAGIKITEKAQPWILGLEQQLPVLFDAQPSTIFEDGTDEIWGKVYPVVIDKANVVVDGDNPTGYGNGHDIADLEYFSMGERGDQYRNVGWPKVIPTTYLVEPDKEYNVLEIHHAFTDTGENSYRSDKDITIVSTDKAVINNLVNKINTATGLNVKTLA